MATIKAYLRIDRLELDKDYSDVKLALTECILSTTQP
jgi:hypothetical protein